MKPDTELKYRGITLTRNEGTNADGTTSVSWGIRINVTTLQGDTFSMSGVIHPKNPDELFYIWSEAYRWIGYATPAMHSVSDDALKMVFENDVLGK